MGSFIRCDDCIALTDPNSCDHDVLSRWAYKGSALENASGFCLLCGTKFILDNNQGKLVLSNITSAEFALRQHGTQVSHKAQTPVDTFIPGFYLYGPCNSLFEKDGYHGPYKIVSVNTDPDYITVAYRKGSITYTSSVSVDSWIELLNSSNKSLAGGYGCEYD